MLDILLAALLLAPTGPASARSARGALLVFCAPGYPGTTAEAQGAMNGFAEALTAAARLPPGSLEAVYHESESEGLRQLASPRAQLAILPLPLYLAQERRLGLRPLLQVVARGGAPDERWSLVARRGRIAGPASLAGWELVSTAAYAPRFVAGPALGGWGRLPPGVKLVFSTAVLSALRRAAAGEPVAVLLDREQAEGLATLPFAAELETVARSPALPVALVAAVGRRLPPPRGRALVGAMERLPSEAAGADALAAIRLGGFAPVDEKALQGAQRAYARARR